MNAHTRARMSSHARLAGGVALASTLTVAIALVLRLVTPSLTFGDGYGFLDGQSYGAMARSLRTGEHFDILSPYAFRVLPAALVAWSGLDYRLGYLLLNMFGYVVAGGALYGLLVATGARARVALLLVAWWAVLPAGVRLSEYYPVLVDGVGAAFLMALLWAAVAGSILACALLLAAGALVRENLIVLTPMVGLLTPGRNAVSAARRALLVVAPAAAVLLWVR